ncbi:MAG TPA: glycosyltransferase [Thermomicrobiales bacterium]|nr:glycosyltransferase [Thermomicrobiales bacterium]
MTDRITVLTVIDSLGVGGAQALLPTFLRHVDRERFDIRILALTAAPSNHIQDAILAEGAPLEQWAGNGLLKMRRIRALANEIRRQQVDLVHSHLLYSNVQAGIAARLTHRPLVATLHNVQQYSPYLKRTIEAGVLRATRARALAVSDGVRRSFRGRPGLSERQLAVVPNAIELQRFTDLTPESVALARQEALAGAPGPLIVAVGRLTPQKGFAILAEAAAIVRTQCPDARFAIAGREADGAAELRAAIQRHNLADVVQLMGQRSDVAQLLAAADIYVSPSLSEGAPVTHLEAMAAGAPVVATRVGGVPEIIRDGDNGLLVPAGQPVPLADALLRLLGDPVLARRMANLGRASVQEFGAEAWARRIECEYLRALGCHVSECREEMRR